MQLDFADPVIPTLVETINAAEVVEVSGFEFDLTVTPVLGLLIGLSYSYLDGDMPRSQIPWIVEHLNSLLSPWLPSMPAP